MPCITLQMWNNLPTTNFTRHHPKFPCSSFYCTACFKIFVTQLIHGKYIHRTDNRVPLKPLFWYCEEYVTCFSATTISFSSSYSITPEYCIIYYTMYHYMQYRKNLISWTWQKLNKRGHYLLMALSFLTFAKPGNMLWQTNKNKS